MPAMASRSSANLPAASVASALEPAISRMCPLWFGLAMNEMRPNASSAPHRRALGQYTRFAIAQRCKACSGVPLEIEIELIFKQGYPWIRASASQHNEIAIAAEVLAHFRRDCGTWAYPGAKRRSITSRTGVIRTFALPQLRLQWSRRSSFCIAQLPAKRNLIIATSRPFTAILTFHMTSRTIRCFG